MRRELDLPLVTAMFEEWAKTPTASMSLLRLQRAVYAWAGIKEKPAVAQSNDDMQTLFGDMAPGERLKIMTPEEWFAGVNGNGRTQ